MAAKHLDLDLQQSLSLHVKLFKFLGFWVQKTNKQLKLIRSLHSILTVTLFAAFLLSQIAFLVFIWGDIEQMADVSVLMFTVLSQFMKIYILLGTPKRIQYIYNKLTEKYFQPRTLKQKEILIDCIKYVQNIGISFTLIIASTIAIWGLFPVLDGTTSIYRLPLPAYFPFDIKQFPHYQIAYIFVLNGIMISGITNAVFDSFGTAFMMLSGGQFAILENSLQNIKLKEKVIKNDYRIAESQEQEFLTEIIYCIQHHGKILELVSDFEEIFSYAILSTFFTSGIELVITLFQLTLIPIVSFQSMVLIAYQICVFFNIYLYCWFGNEITLKSIKIMDAAYESDWYISGYKTYNRTLLLLMIRLQKPLEVKTGIFIPLSIETFTKILKLCWSYFTLLRQVNNME